MKKTVALSAVMTVLALPAQAQTQSADQVRRMVEDLAQRVTRLESENRELKDENVRLKEQQDKLDATAEYLKSNTAASRKQMAEDAVKIEKADALAKNADWANRVAIKGDFRYRHEQIMDDTTASAVAPATADRYRDRVRARVNLEAKPADNVTVGVGMTTTEGGDPRSGNQTLDGTFSRKSLDLDLAYADWKFSRWGNLVGGKMKQPFVKPGQSLFWDGDINPEGLALSVNNGMWFGSGYYYWVDEVSGAETSVTADAALAGLQVGAKIPVGTGSLTLGAHYYDLMAGQGRSGLLFGGSSNGNTTVGGALAFDYEVAELFAEYNTMLGTLPLQLWADVAENLAVDDDDYASGDALNRAMAAGIVLGKASNPKTWELGLMYQSVQKDALFAQLIDSDFGGGTSDSEGYALKFGYAPMKNWTLNATYLKNKRFMDVPNFAGGPTGVNYDRLQLDANFKF